MATNEEETAQQTFARELVELQRDLAGTDKATSHLNDRMSRLENTVKVDVDDEVSRLRRIVEDLLESSTNVESLKGRVKQLENQPRLSDLANRVTRETDRLNQLRAMHHDLVARFGEVKGRVAYHDQDLEVRANQFSRFVTEVKSQLAAIQGYPREDQFSEPIGQGVVPIGGEQVASIERDFSKGPDVVSISNVEDSYSRGYVAGFQAGIDEGISRIENHRGGDFSDRARRGDDHVPAEDATLTRPIRDFPQA